MPALLTDGMTKYYGEVCGIEDLSLSVEAGEVFGFLGPNGAGKTTTIRTLMGFQSPTDGTATVLGADIRDAAALREVRANVGYLPSEPSVDENVTGRRLLDYHGSLRGDVRSDEMLELFDPPLDRKVREYSRGNKQMLAIVMAFMHDPDLLIMDEPTSGLDPLKQEQLLEFIRAEQVRGKTFFFSSHILGEVRKVCDRVAIIRDGTLVELEDVESLLHRSGKTVRARVGGDLDPAALSLDGVHDVEVSGDGAAAGDAPAADAPTEDAATADATSADAATAAAASADAATADAATGDGAPAKATTHDAATTVSFTYTGAYEPLLRALLQYDLLDLTIEEAPLEDVFMRFYGDDPHERVRQVENGVGADRPDTAPGDASATVSDADDARAERRDV